MDFERQIDESEEMKETLQVLKARHADLKRENAAHAKKVEKAKELAQKYMEGYKV